MLDCEIYYSIYMNVNIYDLRQILVFSKTVLIYFANTQELHMKLAIYIPVLIPQYLGASSHKASQNYCKLHIFLTTSFHLPFAYSTITVCSKDKTWVGGLNKILGFSRAPSPCAILLLLFCCILCAYFFC